MTEMFAPEFVTPPRTQHSPPVVSLRPHGGSLKDGLNLSFNAEKYGYILGPEVTGFGPAPVDNTITDLSSGGGLLTHRRVTTTSMFLPIALVSPSPEETRRMYARLVNLVATAEALVDVVVYDPYTYETRYRTGAYVDGLETEDWRSPYKIVVGINLQIADPYWKGQSRSIVSKIAPPTKPFLTASEGDPQLEDKGTVRYRWAGLPGQSASIKTVADQTVAVNIAQPPAGESLDYTLDVGQAAGQYIGVVFPRKVAQDEAQLRIRWENSSIQNIPLVVVSTANGDAYAAQPVFIPDDRYRSIVLPNAPEGTSVFASSTSEKVAQLQKAHAPFDGDTPDQVMVSDAYEFPFFPIYLADSVVQDERKLTIYSSVAVFPTWTITGPGEDLHLKNLDTGEELRVDGPIRRPVTIVTDPAHQSIHDDNGYLWDRTTPGKRDLFPLQPGDNRISMQMVGGDSRTEITCTYEEKYRTAF